MKKLFTLAIMLAFALSSSFASDAGLFSYDQAAVDVQFEQLNELESYVLKNQGVSLTDMQTVNNEILMGLNLHPIAGTPFGPNQAMLDFDLGAFLWGLICCPVGFFVIVTNKDKTGDQKLSYWIGVVVSAVRGSVSGGSVLWKFI